MEELATVIERQPKARDLPEHTFHQVLTEDRIDLEKSYKVQLCGS